MFVLWMAPVAVAYPNSDHTAAAFEMKLSSLSVSATPPLKTLAFSAYQLSKGHHSRGL